MTTAAARAAPERDWPRVTGFDFIDEPLDAIRMTPFDSVNRRLWLCALVGLGIILTGMGSIFLRYTGPIPYKLIPDLRPVLLFAVGFLFALPACWGGANRRRLALWGVLFVVIAFHLEEATVHWIGPYPGSITGTRVGLVGTAGSLLALASMLVLHVEVESERLRRDTLKRGATDAGARDLATKLRQAGTRRIVGLTGAVAGLGALIFGIEKIFGDESTGGAWSLFVGAAILLALAVYLLRIMPGRSQR